MSKPVRISDENLAWLLTKAPTVNKALDKLRATGLTANEQEKTNKRLQRIEDYLHNVSGGQF